MTVKVAGVVNIFDMVKFLSVLINIVLVSSFHTTHLLYMSPLINCQQSHTIYTFQKNRPALMFPCSYFLFWTLSTFFFFCEPKALNHMLHILCMLWGKGYKKIKAFCWDMYACSQACRWRMLIPIARLYSMLL